MRDIKRLVKFGLSQLTVSALRIAKKNIADHPENILMDGPVYFAHQY